MMTQLTSKQAFWNTVWQGGSDTREPAEHPLRPMMEAFVRDHDLTQARILEVGCGAGGLQRLSTRYVGCDLSPECGRYIHPPASFVCSPAHTLPFDDDSFDCTFSIYVLEHLPEIEPALHEIRRVTRAGGLVLLKPAWFCRPWTGREWFHKPAADCTVPEKLLKSIVVVRNSVPWRAAHLAGWRLRGLVDSQRFRCRKLRANFAMPQVIDADAEAWLDPLDMIRWFEGRGDVCCSHPGTFARWLRTSDAVVFRIRKSEPSNK